MIDVPENTTEMRNILKRELARLEVSSGKPGFTCAIISFDKIMPMKAIKNRRKKIKFTDMLANFHARDSSFNLTSIKTGINVVDNVASSTAVII
jgi:hypothetical protein